MKRAFLLSLILGLSVIAANASNPKPVQNCEPGSNEVAVFADRDFGGECRTYISGSSPRPYDKKWNDSISSIKIGKNMKMWLCQDIDFEGTCEMLFKSDSWLGDNKVGDDQVSSFSVTSRNPSLSDRITRGDNTSALRVTNNSVGRIKLGMTIGQARRVMPKKWKLGPTPGGEGSTLVGVFDGKKLLLEIGSFEGIADGEKLPPIDLKQKIQFIGIMDSRFKTDRGVHVGMTIANAEKRYGKLNSMFNYPHGGELGDFTNQPKHMNFNFRPKGNFYTAGIYKPIPNCPNPDYPPSCSNAKEYNPGSYISAIGIKTPPPAQRVIAIGGLPDGLKMMVFGPMEGECTDEKAITEYTAEVLIGNRFYSQSFKIDGAMPCPDPSSDYERTTVMYKEQFDVAYGDYNFDGFTDVAVRDGMDGGYGSATYQVYLFDNATKKFVNNKSMTELAQYQGMFQVMKDEKLLKNTAKSGCCYYTDERYTVKNNRAVKVYEKITDYTAEGATEEKPKVTIKRLVDGKWKEVKE